MAKDTPEDTTMLYIVPIFAVLFSLVSPCLSMAFLNPGKFADAVTLLIRNCWGEPKRLTQLSMISIFLCPFFFLSNYNKSPLALYGLFGALLANANIFVDSFAKRRGWLILLVWQALNLLQMMGGQFSWLGWYLFDGKQVGLIPAARAGPGAGDAGCPKYSDTAWCSEAYITIQLLIAVGFLILHICMLAVVSARVIKEYGGTAMPEEPKVNLPEADAREGLIDAA
jgi:hypothetical protein